MNRIFTALFTVVGLFVITNDSLGTAEPVQVSAVRTNWVDRWITNTTEIRMQANRFVTEYHTNWLTAFRTNYVDLFRTNLITKVVTNTFVLDSVRTNFVQAYQTNLQTLNLTNWTSVLAFKTNWITKPLTNLVEIDMPQQTAPAASVLPVKSGTNPEPLTLLATRSARGTINNQVEIQLSVSWRGEATLPIQVHQWRVEREDGSFLCFGQETQFRRALPMGTYKVLVNAQRDAKSPLLAAVGRLTVTPHEVSLEQRPARSSSSI